MKNKDVSVSCIKRKGKMSDLILLKYKLFMILLLAIASLLVVPVILILSYTRSSDTLDCNIVNTIEILARSHYSISPLVSSIHELPEKSLYEDSIKEWEVELRNRIDGKEAIPINKIWDVEYRVLNRERNIALVELCFRRSKYGFNIVGIFRRNNNDKWELDIENFVDKVLIGKYVELITDENILNPPLHP